MQRVSTKETSRSLQKHQNDRLREGDPDGLCQGIPQLRETITMGEYV